ncbi:phage tailspike protein [Rahnella variigena]|uniref:phage tailspike protein n=1 Tax=Rahnella variigena TaxID=574964 RepID=UPI0028DBC8B9|nr:phage tailspike protein [Rahnella variigena]
MADIVPNVVISMPSQLFTLARSFKAAANGKIYIGKIDTDPTIPSNQIQVYLQNEDGSTVPVAQPILINAGGYPVYLGQISKFVTVEGHSMAIYDGYMIQQFYFPNVLKYDPDQLRQQIEDPDGAINYPRLQIARWRDNGDVRGWGAKGDGVTDDTSAIQAAFNSGSPQIYFPKGVFLQRIHLGIPSNIVIRGAGEGKTFLKMADGVDQVYHSLVSANATSLDARLATLANVDALIGGYISNVTIKDLTIEANNKNRPKTYTDREQGTGLEMQAVQHWLIENVTVNEGVQHCINVRAGTNGYEQGYDYVEKYPSQYVRIVNCKTYNELYDDGITTHDSEYIWIERCETWLTRNSTDVSMTAVSNGIEIDDGSRYVWVTDCYSNGGFGGYQAKGHTNTRPAHHVWFDHCVAENNHMGWILSAVDSPTTDLNSNYATCHHIYLNNCTIKNCYVFSNVTSWAAEGHYIQFYNVRHIYINDLQVIGKTKDMPNMGATQKVWFRSREYNSYIFINNASMINVDERAIDGSPLFTLEANVSDLTIDGLTVDKFTKGQVLFTNSTGVNFHIDNVTLQQGSSTYPVFRINGVGGGTMRFGKVKGSGFSIPFQSSSISADVINYQDYVAIGDGSSNTFHDVSIGTDAAGLGNLVAGVLGIGTQHVAKVGATKYPVGSIFTQVQSGNIADNTASGRMRVAVRAAGSTTPTGVLNISKASLQPAVDNVMSLGTGGLRPTVIYAMTGTINTSDAREKTPVRKLTQAEIAVGLQLAEEMGSYGWLERIQEKGADARLHFGMTVQRAIEIFATNDLDAFEYGAVCFDAWEEVVEVTPAILDDNGVEIHPAQTTVTPAGDRYAFRSDEINYLITGAIRAQQKLIEERLSALELKN